jgi:hypothetical protein
MGINKLKYGTKFNFIHMKKEKHELENTLVNLKQFKKELEEHIMILDSGRGVSISNLPTHFWETLGECINDIEDYIKNHKI